MRCWTPAAAVAVVVTLSACGAKTVAVPTPGAPHYPDFVEPRVPAALAAEPAAASQSRAWLFLQAGDLRNAEREASSALRASSGFFPAATTLGYIDLARRDARGAIERFDRALAADATYAPALAGKGQALAESNQDDEALRAFEAALAADPALTGIARRIDVVRLRGTQRAVAEAQAQIENKDYGDAIETYRDALARSPESAFLHRALALVERDHGDGEQAVIHFRRATELDPGDAASFVDLAAMLDARSEFDGALQAYTAALALEPSAEVSARRDATRLRADVSRLPAEYRAIEDAAETTRADLAALIAVRLPRLVAAAPMRDVGVITDVRGHWAESWMLAVSRAGIVEPFDNHTFQPRAVVRRVDLAQAVNRLLALVARQRPEDARRWQGARGRFTDMTPAHVAYPAASAAVASGVMGAAEGAFQPAQPVSGREATDTIVRLLALAEGGRRR